LLSKRSTYFITVPYLTGLNTLYLEKNQISDLSPLSHLTELTTLRLSNNQITDIASLAYLTRLKVLFLECNQITDFSPIAHLSELIRLDLDKNLIFDLLPLISLLSNKNLKYIYLRSNKIIHLPEAILQASIPLKWDYDLREGIFLSDNPLESPPIEIVKQGHNAVVSYFNQLKTSGEISTVHLHQCKLLLVGSGEVGKTTLMKKLKDPSFKVQPGLEVTTHGINIIPWEILCPFKNAKNYMVKTLFWDFGGQDIYHATHQFFLTKRSLYILVWEARKEEETRSFDYWLNMVKLLGSGSPVIVVMNKSDIRVKSIDQASLQTKFPDIKGFLNVSCLNNSGLTELTELIQKTLGQMPHLQDLLPASWFHIRDELKSINKNYTTADSYFDICKKHNIKRDDAVTIGDYLHDLGTILYFRNDPLLADTVILKPEWATRAVYTLIDTKEINHNKGSFLFHDLKRYWDPKLYPESKHPQMVRLMEKFELCFNFLNTDKYFIPELLPGTPIRFDTSPYLTHGALHFQYQYKFMPEGILSRFIARLFYLIHEKRFWKYGVELRFGQSTALVLSQPLNNRIKIQITGSKKNELLAIIRSHFTHIHQTLNMHAGAHYNEMLPCPCSDCSQKSEPDEPQYFAYDILIKALSSHTSTIQCHSSLEQISVNALLNGFEPSEPGINILTDLIQTAKQVMSLSKSMKPDEDSRTGLLCVLMNEKKFFVKDQARWGQSETGKSMGRLDAMIKSNDGQEAILEAFKLGSFKSDIIESHCLKIFNYDPVGLQNNFIVVYCDCPDKTFTKLWEQYKDFVRRIPFAHPLLSLMEKPSAYSEIKIAQAIHNRHDKEVGIYHLFLHMK